MNLSIVIPLYNVEKYIVRCLNSILNQIDAATEVVLVDDGSKDATVAVTEAYLKKIGNKNIYLLKKKNGGASSARNYPLDKLKGRYVLFVDSDDVILDYRLKLVYDDIYKNDSDLFVYGFDFYYTNGVIEEGWTTSIQSFKIENSNPISLIAEYIVRTKDKLSWYPWGKLFKLEIIKQYGLRFNEDYKCCEDFDFYFRYMLHCKKIIFNNQSLVLYTVTRPGAITSTRALVDLRSDCYSYSGIFKLVLDTSCDIPNNKAIVLQYIANYYIGALHSCKDIAAKDAKCISLLIEQQPEIYYYLNNKKAIFRRFLHRCFGLKIGELLFWALANSKAKLKELLKV